MRKILAYALVSVGLFGCEDPSVQKPAFTNWKIGYCADGSRLIDIDGNGSIDAILVPSSRIIIQEDAYGPPRHESPRHESVLFVADKERDMVSKFFFNYNSKIPSMTPKMQELADLVHKTQ